MIKIFLDCADIETIRKFKDNPLIQGYTTNPSLMAKAGITDYEGFAKEVLKEVKDKPVSFEVFADEQTEIDRQARRIASWGENVFVKIPVTTTKGETLKIKHLLEEGIKINLTAVMGVVSYHYEVNNNLIISIFAGRIADTGVNPEKFFQVNKASNPGAQLLWASPREILNIYQAEEAGADIITCTPDLIAKYEKLKGKDLMEYSLETVKMFYDDGVKAGFKL